jgi:hypothetical protein
LADLFCQEERTRADARGCDAPAARAATWGRELGRSQAAGYPIERGAR